MGDTIPERYVEVPSGSTRWQKRTAPPRDRGSAVDPRASAESLGTYMVVCTPAEPSAETLKWIHMPVAAWPTMKQAME